MLKSVWCWEYKRKIEFECVTREEIFLSSSQLSSFFFFINFFREDDCTFPSSKWQIAPENRISPFLKFFSYRKLGNPFLIWYILMHYVNQTSGVNCASWRIPSFSAESAFSDRINVSITKAVYICARKTKKNHFLHKKNDLFLV